MATRDIDYKFHERVQKRIDDGFKKSLPGEHTPIFLYDFYANNYGESMQIPDAVFDRFVYHHNKFCKTCKESFDYVIENRKIAGFKPCVNGEFTIDVRNPDYGWMSDSLKAGPFLKIVSGETGFLVHNQEFEKAFATEMPQYDNYDLDDKMTVVCGPLIVVGDEFANNKPAGSILSRLINNRNFLLYSSQKRQPEHFWLGPDFIHLERHHGFAQDKRTCLKITSPYLVKYYKDRFQQIVDEGDVRLTKNLERDFLFVTESELAKLRDYLFKINHTLDDVNKSDLERILSEKKYLSSE